MLGNLAQTIRFEQQKSERNVGGGGQLRREW